MGQGGPNVTRPGMAPGGPGGPQQAPWGPQGPGQQGGGQQGGGWQQMMQNAMQSFMGNNPWNNYSGGWGMGITTPGAAIGNAMQGFPIEQSIQSALQGAVGNMGWGGFGGGGSPQQAPQQQGPPGIEHIQNAMQQMLGSSFF